MEHIWAHKSRCSSMKEGLFSVKQKEKLPLLSLHWSKRTKESQIRCGRLTFHSETGESGWNLWLAQIKSGLLTFLPSSDNLKSRLLVSFLPLFHLLLSFFFFLTCILLQDASLQTPSLPHFQRIPRQDSHLQLALYRKRQENSSRLPHLFEAVV